MPRKKVVSKLDPSDKRLKANRKPKNMPATSVGKTMEDGEHIDKVYCRKCKTEKKPSDFFKATDTFLDSNGLQSVCRQCIQEIYVKYYSIEHDLKKAMYRFCRTMNWAYTEKAIESTEKALETNGKSPDDPSVPGQYRGKLSIKKSGGYGFEKAEDGDLTFKDILNKPTTENIDDDAFGDETENLKLFWGDGLGYSDYVFLESELAKYKASHPSDSYSKISLLKDLCHKELEIRRARFEGGSTGGLIKEKQDIMKTLAIDPAKENIASGNKNMEAFGVFIQHIEETEPADYYADKELFKDFDKISWYFEKYVRRPLKNFITGSRDFNVDAEETEEEEDFDDFDKFAPPLEEGTEDAETGRESISG